MANQRRAMLWRRLLPPAGVQNGRQNFKRAWNGLTKRQDSDKSHTNTPNNVAYVRNFNKIYNKSCQKCFFVYNHGVSHINKSGAFLWFRNLFYYSLISFYPTDNRSTVLKWPCSDEAKYENRMSFGLMVVEKICLVYFWPICKHCRCSRPVCQHVRFRFRCGRKQK